VRQRAANASCSLWLRTLASNAIPGKTVVGSSKRPTGDGPEVEVWGRSHRRSWFRCSSRAPPSPRHLDSSNRHCAAEQATRTQTFPSGLLLRIDGRHDSAQAASQTEHAQSRRPERWPPYTERPDTLRHWSFRSSPAHSYSIASSSETATAAKAPPGEWAARAGTLAITGCRARQNGQRNNSRFERGRRRSISAPAPTALARRGHQSNGNRWWQPQFVRLWYEINRSISKAAYGGCVTWLLITRNTLMFKTNGSSAPVPNLAT